ncbi:hypothetical protein [Pendulispora albinea]|uniref:Lipoprotein n=1 Tax=Pendulispora albinea TaxID=2741071 RepID=A0ABZ2LQ29_9BACT
MKSLRTVRASALGLLILGFACAPGCAPSESEDPGFTIDENGRLAPRDVSDSAEVEDGKVSLPITAANEEWVAGLAPGNVIAGNWDTRGNIEESLNPRGFLRKVASIKKTGDRIVITTEPAELNELLYGHLHIDSDKGGLPIFPDAPKVAPAANLKSANLRLLEGGSGSNGNSGVKGSVGHKGKTEVDFRDGVFNFNSHFEADYELKKWAGIPTGVKSAYSKFNTSATVGFSIDVKVEEKFTDEWALPLDQFKMRAPIGASGLTVEIGPSIKCGGSAQGKFKATAKVELKGELTAGFNYKDGNTSLIKDPTTFTPTFTIQSSEGGYTADLKCSMKLDVTIYALDMLGIGFALGPYGKIGSKSCTAAATDGGEAKPGVSFFAEEGIEFSVKLKAKTPIIPISTIEHTLWDTVIKPRGGETPRADSKCCLPGTDGALVVCRTPLGSN